MGIDVSMRRVTDPASLIFDKSYYFPTFWNLLRSGQFRMVKPFRCSQNLHWFGALFAFILTLSKPSSAAECKVGWPLFVLFRIFFFCWYILVSFDLFHLAFDAWVTLLVSGKATLSWLAVCNPNAFVFGQNADWYWEMISLITLSNDSCVAIRASIAMALEFFTPSNIRCFNLINIAPTINLTSSVQWE